MSRASKPRESKQLSQVYQLKITLQDIEPPVWRQIQVADGTLYDLHKHIQTAMGWTNSHLHQFEIGGKLYAPPDPFPGAGWDESDSLDSTEFRLSRVFANKPNGFSFVYEYDFGDGWRHEIVLEGTEPAEPGKRYPQCVDGARACPPDDCGGPGGYQEFLKAIGDPEHEQHEDMLEWIDGEFDPEKFSPTAATKKMHRGFPDGRNRI